VLRHFKIIGGRKIKTMINRQFTLRSLNLHYYLYHKTLVNLPHLTKETQIFIYNALGQLVFRSTLDQKGENRIQLNSAIASGVYHIKLSLDDKMVTKKLIVQ